MTSVTLHYLSVVINKQYVAITGDDTCILSTRLIGQIRLKLQN